MSAESPVQMRRGFDAYQRLALKTAGPLRGWRERVECAALGIAGEGGEYADRIKKVLFQGHARDPEKEAEEIGDVLWYLALAAEQTGYTLGQIADMNLEKLRKRYPDGFSVERSLGRSA